jgi:DnaJ-class molecular chaperone
VSEQKIRWRNLDESHAHKPEDVRPITDPYAVMGVSQDVSDADLKTAYRRLIARWHPDRLDTFLQAWSTRKLQEINLAYDSICAERNHDEQ